MAEPSGCFLSKTSNSGGFFIAATVFFFFKVEVTDNYLELVILSINKIIYFLERDG